MDGDDLNDVEDLFERAIVSEDEAFVLAEERLRQAGSDGAAAARQRLDHPDPVGRLTARVVIDWAEAGDELDRARRYLAALPRRFAGTAAVTPPVRGVVDNLTA